MWEFVHTEGNLIPGFKDDEQTIQPAPSIQN